MSLLKPSNIFRHDKITVPLISLSLSCVNRLIIGYDRRGMTSLKLRSRPRFTLHLILCPSLGVFLPDVFLAPSNGFLFMNPFYVSRSTWSFSLVRDSEVLPPMSLSNAPPTPEKRFFFYVVSPDAPPFSLMVSNYSRN